LKEIILREKIYVPVDDPDDYKDKLDLHFVVDVFDEAQCEPCEYLDVRPCDVCQDCANYLARKKLYNTETRPSGITYIGFPYGKRSLIPRVVPSVENMSVKDIRSYTKFKTKLTFTGVPRPHQEDALVFLEDAFYENRLRGILVAPARSGKTPTSIALACRLKLRTLVLVNEDILASQFYKTCYGSPNGKSPPLTNAPELDAKYGGRCVVRATKDSDLLEGDIVITTYQKFISAVGKERLAKVVSLFGLVIVDEAHRANADSFLKVLAAINSAAKLGLTATVTRKDGMDVLAQYVLGPVLYKIKVPTLIPRVVFHETGLFPKKDYSNFIYYLRWLERQTDRTAMIIDQVMKDLKAGRSIVMGCTFTTQTHELVRRINWVYGSKIAAAVVGGGTSKKEKARVDDILERASEGTLRVIIGTRSKVMTGTNVPLWDTLYWINPLSNPPNWVQEYSRILTPLEGKEPIIRMFLDGSSQTRGCLRTCLFKTEGDTATLASSAKIAPEQWAIANAYLKRGKMHERVITADSAPKKTKNGRLAL
jgi:superfamily II DNA or RNA helicase